jgi:hypothetical protein
MTALAGNSSMDVSSALAEFGPTLLKLPNPLLNHFNGSRDQTHTVASHQRTGLGNIVAVVYEDFALDDDLARLRLGGGLCGTSWVAKAGRD